MSFAYTKLLFFFAGSFFFLKVSGQQVENTEISKCSSGAIINGELTNKLLTWDDFRGIPDDKSSFHAYTYWNMKSDVINVKFRKDTVVLTYTAYAEFKDSSWVKKGKETDALLKHEQGHFNVARLCAIEINQVIKSTIFLRNEFPGKFNSIFKEILDKYRLMNWEYDLETNHSNDKANQKKWDDLFKERLSKSE